MDLFVILVCVISGVVVIGGNIPPKQVKPTERPKELVFVSKCCPATELMVNQKCRSAAEMNSSVFAPLFSSESGTTNPQINYSYIIGFPNCGSRQSWTLNHNDANPEDQLKLLPDGRLRHTPIESKRARELDSTAGSDQDDESIKSKTDDFYDYQQEKYCVEKNLFKNNGNYSEMNIAIICVPENDMEKTWRNADFVFRRILDPVFHAIAIICFLIVAIVHFVFPQLRDLVGNIITTISICFFLVHVAEIVKIFTEFHNEISFLVADSCVYICLLGAFFWLNGLGYYIWKTFRSRNVFLRITDGRKYCYYSLCVWGSTAVMTALALFAHLTLDTDYNVDSLTPSPFPRGSIGWLGIAVFFTPIASTILVNIFFYVSTAQIISRMRTYGRIHHKMKYSFQTFIKLFIVMLLGWIFMILSWLRSSTFSYCYIIINLIHALLIFYISIISPKKVRFLLQKACCYEKCIFTCCRPNDSSQATEWGEEMMAMNRSPY